MKKDKEKIDIDTTKKEKIEVEQTKPKIEFEPVEAIPNEQEKAKSKYKAKKEKQKEEQEQQLITYNLLANTLLEFVCMRLPVKKPLTTQETDSFSSLFSQLANKYASILGSYDLEASFLFVTFSIIYPRLKSDD